MPAEELPAIGLGTYSDDNREQWAENVRTALDIGYRHIDTAQVYRNEEYVAEGIRRSDVEREDVFLATKTVHHDVPPAPEDVGDAIDGCLERLEVDYVDLLYVHWPSGIYDHETILPHFQAAYDDGKIRYVGLSNFTPQLIDEATEILDAPILACQVERHPLLQQEELVEHTADKDMWLVSYTPLARGAVFDVPEIQTVAEKHDASPAQVCLAWNISEDHAAAIPKASSESHMRENLNALDIGLDDEDLELIGSIDQIQRCIDREYAPWN